MIEEIQSLLDKYAKWLKDKTSLRQVKDWIEITTPYLDRHNDYIQIYAKRDDGGYILTDDGYIIEDLMLSGCELDSPKRKALLEISLKGFGVKEHERALEVHATADNFALRKHNLIQAILAINDMFYLAQPMVASLFYEDVVRWLDLKEIRYTPRVKFTGRSGYDHLFDFVIPKSRKRPERILRAINRPNKDTSQALVFSWIDTKDVRPPESQAYAVLNDGETTIHAAVIDALRNYAIKPMLWSQRETMREELAA